MPLGLRTRTSAISAAPAAGTPCALDVELDGEKEEDAAGEDGTDYVANHGGPRED